MHQSWLFGVLLNLFLPALAADRTTWVADH